MFDAGSVEHGPDAVADPDRRTVSGPIDLRACGSSGFLVLGLRACGRPIGGPWSSDEEDRADRAHPVSMTLAEASPSPSAIAATASAHASAFESFSAPLVQQNTARLVLDLAVTQRPEL